MDQIPVKVHGPIPEDHICGINKYNNIDIDRQSSPDLDARPLLVHHEKRPEEDNSAQVADGREGPEYVGRGSSES